MVFILRWSVTKVCPTAQFAISFSSRPFQWSESFSWSHFVSVIIAEKKNRAVLRSERMLITNSCIQWCERKGVKEDIKRKTGGKFCIHIYIYKTALWLIPYLPSINICLNRGSFINEPNGKYAHSSICAVWEKIFKYLFSKPPRVAQIIDTTLRRSIFLNMSVYIHLSALGIWNYKISLFIRSSVNTLRLIFTAA